MQFVSRPKTVPSLELATLQYQLERLIQRRHSWSVEDDEFYADLCRQEKLLILAERDPA